MNKFFIFVFSFVMFGCSDLDKSTNDELISESIETVKLRSPEMNSLAIHNIIYANAYLGENQNSKALLLLQSTLYENRGYRFNTSARQFVIDAIRYVRAGNTKEAQRILNELLSYVD